MKNDDYKREAVDLLCRLIATPRVSRDEAQGAGVLMEQMEAWGLRPRREGNNVWSVCPDYEEGRPTLMLNAHIDTVKPVATWQRDPFVPTVEGDRLYGLGSNDCGGGLVSLLMTYRHLINNTRMRAWNVLFLATAEEEVSGGEGVARVLPQLPPVHMAIVGEPTCMQPAIAEKGLMVIDGYAYGKSGHAARNEGVNAIYEAIDDLQWLRSCQPERVSPLLGPTKVTVTMIEAGTQHNVVPDKLHFVVDVRTNELYRNEEVFEMLQAQMKKCELKARSFRPHSSGISMEHPVVQRCVAMGMKPFGSPTLSDQAQMPFDSMKLGPGDSARSHTADEYVCLSEIGQAIDTYIELLTTVPAITAG